MTDDMQNAANGPIDPMIPDLRESLHHQMRALGEKPKELFDLRRDLSQCREYQDSTKLELQSAKAELTASIALETNPDTGKPTYSNKELRDGELLRRSQHHALYQTAEKNLADAKRDAEEILAKMDLAEREFSAAKVLVPVIHSELNQAISMNQLAADHQSAQIQRDAAKEAGNLRQQMYSRGLQR